MYMYLHTYGEAFLTNIKQRITSVMGTVHRDADRFSHIEGLCKSSMINVINTVTQL